MIRREWAENWNVVPGVESGGAAPLSPGMAAAERERELLETGYFYQELAVTRATVIFTWSGSETPEESLELFHRVRNGG